MVVLDKLDYCASLKNLSVIEGSPNYRFVQGDILSGDLLSYLLQQEEIDTVLHFAAQTHVDNSFGNSLAFTINNAYGTHVLLESCRRYGSLKRFINVSTDEVYGETSLGLPSGLPESSRLEPTNPYSAAKAGAEMIAQAYFNSYALPVITTRSNNVYGPHQFPEKMIPKFALLASRGDRLPIHGTGKATRSYLHVDDVAKAFDIVIHRGIVGEIYNIGSRRERTVLEVAADICTLFGLDPQVSAVHVRDRAFNDRRYFICDEKLLALGWTESISWEEGLKSTVDWYLKHGFSDWWDPASVESALRAHPEVPTMKASMNQEHFSLSADVQLKPKG